MKEIHITFRFHNERSPVQREGRLYRRHGRWYIRRADRAHSYVFLPHSGVRILTIETS